MKLPSIINQSINQSINQHTWNRSPDQPVLGSIDRSFNQSLYKSISFFFFSLLFTKSTKLRGYVFSSDGGILKKLGIADFFIYLSIYLFIFIEQFHYCIKSIKGALDNTSITSSPIFSKKSWDFSRGIFIQWAVFVHVGMGAHGQWLHAEFYVLDRLIYFEEILIFIAFSIFQSRFQ